MKALCWFCHMEENTQTLQMQEDYCCGGGHCGPLPGYTFTCMACEKPTYIRTGNPLKVDANFICSICQANYTVLEILPDTQFAVKFSKASA